MKLINYIYVAGPISQGDKLLNAHKAIDVGNQLMNHGFTPFVPHLSVYWHNLHAERDYEDWMSYDFRWILRCDALLRLQGYSPGADREVEFCVERGIPVFHSIAEIILHNDVFAEAAQ